MDFDKTINESNGGIYYLPNWLDKAIQEKNKNVQIRLANSMPYRLSNLDKTLCTGPYYSLLKIYKS